MNRIERWLCNRDFDRHARDAGLGRQIGDLRDAFAIPPRDWTYEQASLVLRYYQAAPSAPGARAAAQRIANLDAERELRAFAYGGSVEELKNDALRQAAQLFGPDAALEIVSVKGIATSVSRSRGAFNAEITVRALRDAGLRPVTSEAS